jgi:hypothetical protein
MKRIIYILTALAAAVVMGACGPKVDEQMVAMDNFMDAQDAPGIYRDSKVEYAFDEEKNQAFFSKSLRTFRIMNDNADKYIQFKLSADPVVGQTVDVEAKSYGFGLASNTTYKGLMVDKIENNLCYLRSSAEGGYVGIIIAWIE